MPGSLPFLRWESHIPARMSIWTKRLVPLLCMAWKAILQQDWQIKTHCMPKSEFPTCWLTNLSLFFARQELDEIFATNNLIAPQSSPQISISWERITLPPFRGAGSAAQHDKHRMIWERAEVAPVPWQAAEAKRTVSSEDHTSSYHSWRVQRRWHIPTSGCKPCDVSEQEDSYKQLLP